jgi:hypothetical protein
MTIIIAATPCGKVPVKIQGRQGIPGGLDRLLSRNEKTTGAPFEPARGFNPAIDSCPSTVFTPARQAKKAAVPKVKTCE